MKQLLWSTTLLFVFLFTIPTVITAQITKAVGGDYITLMGVPENLIDDQYNLYKGQGYMPVFVDIAEFNGKPLPGSGRINEGIFATMIFKKNPNRTDVQLIQYNSSNAIVASYGTLKAQGWYISNLDACAKGNGILYLAIWVKGNSEPWGIVINQTPNQHQNTFNQLSSEGYKMINRVIYEPFSPGEAVDEQFTSLFRKQQNAIVSRSGLTYAEYAKMCMGMKQQNFVLTFLNVRRGAFSPIFTHKPGFTPLSAFPTHKQDALTAKKGIEQWSKEGYYPLFVTCDSGFKEDYYPHYAVWLVKAN